MKDEQTFSKLQESNPHGNKNFSMKQIPDDGVGLEVKLLENLSHSHFSHL